MVVIGITGGVGAGKSEILKYLKERYNCRIVMADQVAHSLEEPGEKCYDSLVALLGAEIVGTDGRIDKQRMAGKIFGNAGTLAKVNAIVHPAVKEAILDMIAEERRANTLDFFFLEAALLIEDGYERIVDEMWYIHAEVAVRQSRLKASRGYSDERIEKILGGQLSEEEYRSHCRVVIENNGTLECVYKQIDEKLGEYLCQK